MHIDGDVSNIFSVCLYVNKKINSKNPFTISDLHAISKFTVTNNSRTHDLYFQKDQKFTQVPELHSTIGNVITNSLHYISKNLTVENPNQEKSIIFIYNKNNYPSESNNNFDYLMKKAKEYKNLKSRLNASTNLDDVESDFCGQLVEKPAPPPDGPNGGKCGPPCGEEENKNCNTAPGPLPGDPPQSVCKPPVCFENSIFSRLSEEGLLPGELDSIFNFSLHYNLRDSFLYKSDLGLLFGSYYYTIGDIYINQISLDLALETALVLKDFNRVVRRLTSNNSIYDNEVFINDDMCAKIKLLIKHYKEFYSDDLTDVIFNDIQREFRMCT